MGFGNVTRPGTNYRLAASVEGHGTTYVTVTFQVQDLKGAAIAGRFRVDVWTSASQWGTSSLPYVGMTSDDDICYHSGGVYHCRTRADGSVVVNLANAASIDISGYVHAVMGDASAAVHVTVAENT